jgi:hypothetical protein
MRSNRLKEFQELNDLIEILETIEDDSRAMEERLLRSFRRWRHQPPCLLK